MLAYVFPNGGCPGRDGDTNCFFPAEWWVSWLFADWLLCWLLSQEKIKSGISDK